MTRSQIIGAAALAGIGFTVSPLITGPAYAQQPALETQRKVGVLTGSFGSGSPGGCRSLLDGATDSRYQPRRRVGIVTRLTEREGSNRKEGL
ncbi:MAG: Na+/H+ antiporter NhaA [Actinobacteria bacterium]|nr:Na+/H+ antiporter NhaA [Actinomycetota bacterium]